MKKTIFLFSFLPFLILEGCSSSPHIWEDERYATAMDTGKNVFERGHMAQASLQYKNALNRALAANDAQSIHDSGYNLAISQLRDDKIKECLSTLDYIANAIKIRGWHTENDLQLVRASAFYRLGKWSLSEKEARNALLSKENDVSEQAYSILGLTAFEEKNRNDLLNSIEKLKKYKSDFSRVNLLELQTCQYLLDHMWSEAIISSQQLVLLRQKMSDYREMRRALKLQVKSYEGNGEGKKANMIRYQIKDSATH